MAKETDEQRRKRLKIKQEKEKKQKKQAQVAPRMTPGYPKTPVLTGTSFEQLNDVDLPAIFKFRDMTKNLSPRDIKRVMEGKHGSGW